MAALGIQSMFLPTPYGGTSTEWVKCLFHSKPDVHLLAVRWVLTINIFLSAKSNYRHVNSLDEKGA